MLQIILYSYKLLIKYNLSSPPPPCPISTLPLLCWPDFPHICNHHIPHPPPPPLLWLIVMLLSLSPPTTAADENWAPSLLPSSDIQSHCHCPTHEEVSLPPPLSPSGRNHHLVIVGGGGEVGHLPPSPPSPLSLSLSLSLSLMVGYCMTPPLPDIIVAQQSQD